MAHFLVAFVEGWILTLLLLLLLLLLLPLPLLLLLLSLPRNEFWPLPALCLSSLLVSFLFASLLLLPLAPAAWRMCHTTLPGHGATKQKNEVYTAAQRRNKSIDRTVTLLRKNGQRKTAGGGRVRTKTASSRRPLAGEHISVSENFDLRRNGTSKRSRLRKCRRGALNRGTTAAAKTLQEGENVYVRGVIPVPVYFAP